jgi:hypothetical protein
LNRQDTRTRQAGVGGALVQEGARVEPPRLDDAKSGSLGPPLALSRLSTRALRALMIEEATAVSARSARADNLDPGRGRRDLSGDCRGLAWLQGLPVAFAPGERMTRLGPTCRRGGPGFPQNVRNPGSSLSDLDLGPDCRRGRFGCSRCGHPDHERPKRSRRQSGRGKGGPRVRSWRR